MNYGDVICDLHDGLSLPDGATLVKSFKVRSSGGPEFIRATLRDQCVTDHYTNKTVVVIGEADNGNLICAASYDACSLHFFEIAGLT